MKKAPMLARYRYLLISFILLVVAPYAFPYNEEKKAILALKSTETTQSHYFLQKIKEGLLLTIQTYGLAFATTLAHEIGHALTAWCLCDSSSVYIILGTTTQRPPMVTLGPVHITSFNPIEGASFSDKSHKNLPIWREIARNAAGPAAALLFTYGMSTIIPPHSTLAFLNKSLQIGAGLTQLLPAKDTDGMHVAQTLGLNASSMRLAIGLMIGSNLYTLAKDVYYHSDTTTHCIAVAAYIFYICYLNTMLRR